MRYEELSDDQQFLISLGREVTVMNARLTVCALDREKPNYIMVELAKHTGNMLAEIDKALTAM